MVFNNSIMEVINKYYKLFKLCLIFLALILYVVINRNSYSVSEVGFFRVNAITGKIYVFSLITGVGWVDLPIPNEKKKNR